MGRGGGRGSGGTELKLCQEVILSSIVQQKKKYFFFACDNGGRHMAIKRLNWVTGWEREGVGGGREWEGTYLVMMFL